MKFLSIFILSISPFILFSQNKNLDPENIFVSNIEVLAPQQILVEILNTGRNIENPIVQIEKNGKIIANKKGSSNSMTFEQGDLNKFVISGNTKSFLAQTCVVIIREKGSDNVCKTPYPNSKERIKQFEKTMPIQTKNFCVKSVKFDEKYKDIIVELENKGRFFSYPGLLMIVDGQVVASHEMQFYGQGQGVKTYALKTELKEIPQKYILELKEGHSKTIEIKPCK